jgi:hypothetical protein
LGLHTYDLVPGRAAFMSANKDESHEVALIKVGENAPGTPEGLDGTEPHGLVHGEPVRPQRVLH